MPNPSSDLDLCYLTATDAIAAFKAGTLSPVDVLKAQMARIEATNPKINAITHTYFDEAMDAARKAEARYRSGADVRPLEGVTCAIKDYHVIKGKVTTFGSAVFKDFRPDNTAPTVERLIEAGAIVHCRTTTPEFGHCFITWSPLWGVTGNPWNPERTPGGSGGGGAAAVAAGMTTLSDGTDAGGSVRLPASLCGAFGFKPPFGRNPLDREHPGEELLHYGPIARSVADCAAMQNVMSGPHNADIYSLRDKLVLPMQYESIKGLKLAYSIDLGFCEVDPEIRKNTLAAVEVFRSLGCTVEEVNPGFDWDIHDTVVTVWEALFWASFGETLEEWRDRLDPFVVKLIENGRTRTASDMIRSRTVKYNAYQKVAPILEKYDALIAPATAIPAPPADRKNDDPLEINGKSVRPYLGWGMTYPFNLISQIPAMSVPSGFCKRGVPTGVQIIGKTFDDLSVFRIAAAYEGAYKMWETHRPKL